MIEYTSELVDTMCGTRFYEAPEVMMGESYNNMADIWSIGVCLYEMISSNFVLPFTIPGEVLKYAMDKFNYKPLPTNNHPFLVPIVQQMLNKKQDARPRAEDVLEKINRFRKQQLAVQAGL